MTLERFFEENNKIAVAFSGGVDSVYLLYTAVKAGIDVKAYCVRSAFQPAFETSDAVRMAEDIGCGLKIIDVDILADKRITDNPEDRCYYCKQHILKAIRDAASADGYKIICDGTNASDDADDRPGFKALKEFGVISPLRECGLTKDDIRWASKAAGLSTWNKPAYACLATRIKHGGKITAEKLEITEKAEMLIEDMGFSDFRVRMRGNSALVQIKEDQMERAADMAEDIKKALGAMYDEVRIDEAMR